MTSIRTALLFGLLIASASQPASAGAPADMILAHGRILTVDAHDSIAQAVAIRGGKIIRVGADTEVLALRGPKTQLIDLAGRAATPGLIDTHAHISSGGVADLYGVNLSTADSVGEVVKRVKAGIAKLKPGQWLVGSGWDEGKLAEKRYVLAADLDPVSPNNPVWLNHTTGHYGVANSAALRLANLTAASKDPPAGTIDRDASGQPTGVLKEAAKGAVEHLIPPYSAEQLQAGLLQIIETLHREGMTAVKDPMIDVPVWQAYRRLLADGKLNVHVCVLWMAGSTLDTAKAALTQIQAQPKPPAALGDGQLLSCGAKIFMDGSGGARTAWLYHDWNKHLTETDRGNTGYPTTAPDVYRQQVQMFHAAGVHVGTHAIGDQAIDTVVDTYAEVLKQHPVKGLRHSIIHANIPSEHAIDAMASLQRQYDAGYPELQPPFMWWIGDTYAGNFGPERNPRLLPLKTLLARHVRWGGGSDYGVTPLPARYGLWASVKRETLNGTYGRTPFGTDEAVDIHTALRSYTAWAAPQLFIEQRTGTIEVGKDADIAIWDRDPYRVPGEQLRDLRCELTLFQGKIVYRASTTAATR